MLRRKLTLIIILISLANMAIWQSVSQGADTRVQELESREIVLESAPAQIPTPQNAIVPPSNPVPEITKSPTSKKPKTSTPKKTETPVESTPTETVSSTPITHWGVLIRPYNLKTGNVPFTTDMITVQLDLAKELGVTDVRANVEQLMSTNDVFVDESIARGLEPILILEAPAGSFNGNVYQQAYEFGKTYAARYKGKVRYYQLANEASGMAIRPGYSGKEPDDYDATRYHETLNIMRGLGEGVQAADSSAKRIISANWMGTGIIDRLVTDEVDFNTVGWDWYSGMGVDLIKQLPDGAFNIPKYLSKYKKDFWIVEANRDDGTHDGNTAAQASYLDNLIKNVASHHNTQGFFVFGLTDACGESGKSTGHMGLVTVVESGSGLCTIGDKKPAFDVFKNAIAKYSK